MVPETGEKVPHITEGLDVADVMHKPTTQRDFDLTVLESDPYKYKFFNVESQQFRDNKKVIGYNFKMCKHKANLAVLDDYRRVKDTDVGEGLRFKVDLERDEWYKACTREHRFRKKLNMAGETAQEDLREQVEQKYAKCVQYHEQPN